MISEERQTHLAHVIVDGIWNDDLVEYTDEDLALRVGKRVIAQWIAEVGDLDKIIRAKLATLKKPLIEGTPEWTIMYQKYYEEEVNRRGNK